MKFFFSGFTD